MKSIHKLFFGASLLLFASCSETNLQPVQQSQEKVVLNLDFESGAEGFVVNKFGDHVAGKAVINLKDEKSSKCGTLYRGKTADFTVWKGYDFKGNDTQFMGLDMGACKGVFRAVVETKFQLQSALSKGKAKLKFKYYMPGDFTGWKSGYYFNVYLEEKNPDYNNGDSLDNTLQKFVVKVNPNGWVNFSEDLAIDLAAGEYKLLVEIFGSSAAIDNIQLVE